jgi:hypothetical protein
MQYLQSTHYCLLVALLIFEAHAQSYRYTTVRNDNVNTTCIVHSAEPKSFELYTDVDLRSTTASPIRLLGHSLLHSLPNVLQIHDPAHQVS